MSLTGTKAANYFFTGGTQTATIIQLTQATWTGGAGSDNNWFNPGNWANGAVPDLANVKNVVLPLGTVFKFDSSSVTAPAQAGAVTVENITTWGGSGTGQTSLNMTAGTLNVSNMLTLPSLVQTGGTLAGSGTISLDTFSQTAGTVANTGNFTVAKSFTQGAAGNVAVGGSADITQLTGNLTIGQLSAANIKLTASAGNITQTSTSLLTSPGLSTLIASGDITLNNTSNDFGTLSATAADIRLVDKNSLILATVNSTGALGLSALGGSITQNSGTSVTAGGISTLGASSNITLLNTGNDFTGLVNASGTNISLADANSMTLGAITASAKLLLETGQGTSDGGANGYTVTAPINLAAGQNFSTKTGSASLIKDFTVITTLGAASDATTSPAEVTLQGVAATSNLYGNFVLGANIAADATSTTAYNNSAGFIPVGETGQEFFGSFDGLGHTITNLFVDKGATAGAGLFGFTMGRSSIQNIGLVGGSVTGGASTGGLVGDNGAGNISNSYNTGTVKGAASTGGLIGNNATGTISNSYAKGNVTGAAATGGLVGANATGSIANSYALGNVKGAAGSGGLAGTTTGTVTNSYAMGQVAGGASTGGLLGSSTNTVIDSFATGNVTGTVGGVSTAGGAFGVGGLIGASTGTVSRSYALGTVTGGTGVGGLLGQSTGIITNTYAKGAVTANSNAGGLIGDSTGPVINSYATGIVVGAASTTGALLGTSKATNSNNFWDKSVSSIAGVGAADIPGGVTGLTALEMKTQSIFTNAGWDFATTWLINPDTTPLLRSLFTPFTVTASNASKVYDGGAYTGGYQVTYLNTPSSFTGSDVNYSGSAQYATDAGSYTIKPTLVDNQQFLVTYVNGSLTITPAPVSLAATRAYDGTLSVAASNFTLSGLLNSDTLGLSGIAALSTKDVGTNKAVALGSLALIDGQSAGKASNYTLLGSSPTATITAASVTAAATRVYDGKLDIETKLFSLTGLATGETLELTGLSTLVSKNASPNSQTINLNTLALANTATAKASNYNLTSGSALITQAQLTATVNPYSKVFDNTLAANPTFNIAGLIGSETVLATGVATFNSKDVLNANLITFSSTQIADGTLGGLASNYKLPSSGVFAAGQTMGASITPKTLNVTVTNTGNKIYNGLTDTSVTLSSDALNADIQIVPVANFNGDAFVVMSSVGGVNTVSITNSAANFDNKNVGTDKTITVSGLTIAGANMANYKLASTIATSTGAGNGTIIAKNITVTAAGKNKVYDATAIDAVTLSSSGVVLGDRITFSGAATFDLGKNVGKDKDVTVSGIDFSSSVSNVAKANYNIINKTTATTATITPKAIVVTATSLGKEYDGKLDDAVTLASTDILTPVNGAKDAIGFTNTSALFATKTAGASKAVTVSGIALTGADKDNYTSNTTAKTSATITPKTITVTATGIGKVYDGNLIDAVTLSSTGIITGDTVTYSKKALFIDKNAGTDKTVNVTSIRLGGLDGANYKANTTATTTANITPKPITVTATGINKVYDGLLDDKVTLRATGMISGDAYGLSSTSALFANKNVGVGKLVTVNGITLTGVNAGNYTTNEIAFTKATITQKSITVLAKGIDKVYDGNVIDSVTLSSLGLVAGDELIFQKTKASFSNSAVGNGKVVTVIGISASGGADLLNYKLLNTTATTSASITLN
jgi:hypothetical protein